MRKPSPATAIALLALFVALGGVGIAANGQSLILGQSNSATSNTSLSAPVPGGKALQLTNNDSTAGASSALGLTVAAGHAPLTVNSTAGKASNLNADKLDGFNASATPTANTLLALGANGQFPRSVIPGKVTALFQNRPGPLPLTGTFTTSGGNLVVSASGSGWRNSTIGTIGMHVVIDGAVLGVARTTTNEVTSHKSFVLTSAPITGLSAGAHTLRLDFLNLTTTDSSDFYTAIVEETAAAVGAGQDFLEPNDTRPNQVDVCDSVLPDQAFWANTSTATDEDWYRLDCNPSNVTTTLTLTGGALMDVYDNNNSGVLVASNVTSYSHQAFAVPDDFTIRVHSASAVQYKFVWSYS
jgi:hypothetical protein